MKMVGKELEHTASFEATNNLEKKDKMIYDLEASDELTDIHSGKNLLYRFEISNL